jgi:nucleotide-binding universal stress UspA family protein
MKSIKSIVAATDFSQEARHGAERAGIVAEEQQARLDLLHVISRSSLDALDKVFRTPADIETKLVDNARSMLNELIADIGKKTPVAMNACIKIGRVLDEVLSASESADLLVLGAHGLNPLRDLILGTTAERLLRICKRSVLVTKRPPQARYEHVLVPVDFSLYSTPALAMAKQIAPNARITIIHAFRVPFEGKLRLAGVAEDSIQKYSEEERREAVKKVSDLIHATKDGTYRISYAVEHGGAPRVILAKEEELSSDLIVIGKHGRSMVEEWILGGVTRHVLAGSKCDVLVVHERP